MKKYPLWTGKGKGVFQGMEAPETVEEFVGCLMKLFTVMITGSATGKKKLSAEEEHTFRGRAVQLAEQLESSSGATWKNVFDEMLQGCSSLYILFMGTLLDWVLPDYEKSNGHNEPFKTKSFLLFRLTEPLKKDIAALRKNTSFRFHFRPSEPKVPRKIIWKQVEVVDLRDM